MTTATLDLTADIIDVRDIINRYEALEDASDGLPDAMAQSWGLWREYIDPDATMTEAEFDAMTVEQRIGLIKAAFDGDEDKDSIIRDEERTQLAAILDELKGNGGDEQWRGDWYPCKLICDSYFTYYAREMLEDCTIPCDLPSWVEIDWDATAGNVQVDYTPVKIDGSTYWYR